MGGTAVGKAFTKVDTLHHRFNPLAKTVDSVLTKNNMPTGRDVFGDNTTETEDIVIPGAPTVDDAYASEDASRSLARRRGRQSTVLAGTDLNQPTTSAKTLLGA